MLRARIMALGLAAGLSMATGRVAAEPEAAVPPVLPETPETPDESESLRPPDEGESVEASPEDEGTASSEGSEGSAPPAAEDEPSLAEPADESSVPVSEEDSSPADGEEDPPPGDEELGDDDFGDDADEEPWPDEEPVTPTPDYDPLRDSPQALRATHWVRTGIATVSVGGALLVGAVLMATSDPCNLDIGNSCQPTARNRAALVMGLPALALIGGGTAALTVGMQRRRALTVDLRAGRGRLGVGVRGRF